MDRMNFFNPYVDKKVNHEDVLTRNFLLLVKNIPAIQISFLELIRSKMNAYQAIDSIALGELRVDEVHTQVTSGTSLMASYTGYTIVSVIISDDEFETNHQVKESERKARYDGLIVCDPKWMFIIENKPSVFNIWEKQLDPNKYDAEQNELVKDPCRLSWRNIITVLNNLLFNATIVGLEKTLVEDFLEYVNETYSWLNPYDKLSRCNGDKWLIDNRCADVLEEIYGENTKYHKGWKKFIDTASTDSIVRQVALDYDSKYIKLWMYAGEIMSSARRLYEIIDMRIVNELIDKGYTIAPNFHMSYRGSGLVWLRSTKIDVNSYISFWVEEQKNDRIRQIKRDEVHNYYGGLVDKNIVDENEQYIKEKIISKNYPAINIIPGCLFQYVWTLDEAAELDDKGLFVSECKAKIETIKSIYI